MKIEPSNETDIKLAYIIIALNDSCNAKLCYYYYQV